MPSKTSRLLKLSCQSAVWLGVAFASTTQARIGHAQALRLDDFRTGTRAVDEFELPTPAWEIVEPTEIQHSLRQAGHHPVDELDRPRFTRRRNHRGYEVRTFHFVVTSTHSEAQAEALAAELETSWREVGKLADAFTANHRQSTFGLNAVGVLVSDQPFSDRAAPQGPNAANADSDIFLFAPQGELNAEHVADLRRQSTRSLLRVAQLDQTLPRWVQDGLVELTARQATVSLPADGGGAAPRSVSEVGRPDRTLAPSLATAPHTWLERSSADRLPSGEDMAGAAEALAYLLLADDGQRAPQVLGALAEIVRAEPAGGPTIAPVRQAAFAATFAGQAAESQRSMFTPEAISGQADFGEKLAAWSANPWQGLPELVVTDKQDSELVSQAAEMLVLLKLARRYGVAEAAPIQPRISHWQDTAAAMRAEDATKSGEPPDAKTGLPAQAQAAPAVSPQPQLSAAHLVARLSDPNQVPWATLDAEGRLLLWYDESRVEQLIGRASRQLSNGEHEGQATLLAKLPDGRMAEARWQEPVQVGQRPQVHVRWK